MGINGNIFKGRGSILLLTLLLWGTQLSVSGENDFVKIDWSGTSFLTDPPLYQESRELGSDYASFDFSVRVEYPEYKQLTVVETEKAKKWKDLLSDTVCVDYHLAVSRKVGYMDISFIPLIRKGNKYFRLLSAKIAIYKHPNGNKPQTYATLRSKASGVESSSPYTNKSVLSEGKWVKIAVSQEGVYQLSPAFLQSIGFKDPSRVKLYGYGGLRQDTVITYQGAKPSYDDLNEVPLFRGNGKLLFYAHGLVNWNYSNSEWKHLTNTYSTQSCYFLTEGDDVAPLSTSSYTMTGTSSKRRDNVMAHALYEEDAHSWYTSGEQFFDSYDFASGATHSYVIPTPLLSTGDAKVRVRFSASSDSNTGVQVSLNGTSLGSMTVAAKGAYKAKVKEAIYTTGKLSEKNNTLKFTVTQDHPARLDYIRVTYPQQLSVQKGFLVFSDPRNSGLGFYGIASADKNTRVWRIGNATRPLQEVEGSLNDGIYEVVLPDVKDLYVAVNTASSFPQPSVIGPVKNQNLHKEGNFDMVIIVPESGKLTNQAQRLAKAHSEKNGLRVNVVRADEIYNEFSSGTPDAMAYRRYMKMLYDRAQSEEDVPRYLLLFGPSAWDNRMITDEWKRHTPQDYLLCYESQNSISETDSYVSDDFFGYLDNGEGKNLTTEKIDLGIGRIPVETEEQAQGVVNKLLSYMQNKGAGAWKNKICVMGDDDEQSTSLMVDAEEVAARIEEKNPDYLVKRVYWDAYERSKDITGATYPRVREDLLNTLQQGTLIMNYIGHGSPYQISHERVLVTSDFEEMKLTHLPLWVSASCEISPFDGQESTIGEASLVNPSGGAIAFMSATRAVYSTRNKYLNKFYMDYVLGKDAQGRRYSIGDALRLAKVALVSTNTGADQYMTDKTINKLKYALLGDPALVLPTPDDKVVIDSINGQSVRGEESVCLPSGSVAHIKGHIERADGNTAVACDGLVTVSVYDRKEKVVCRNNLKLGGSPFTYQDWRNKMFEGTDSIVGGFFQISFPVGADVNISEEPALLSAYAVSGGDTLEAHGQTRQFHVSDPLIASMDTIGPKIFAYLNNPDFSNGDKVHSTPYFVAYLEDESGINATGSGIGHDLELIVDADPSQSYILNNYFANDFGSYTKGAVRFTLPQLSLGAHKLVFRAWDVQNNSSSVQLNFRVSRDSRPSILDVKASQNPAVESTSFLISYDRPNTEVQIHLDVYDSFGQHVWRSSVPIETDDGHYSLPWNLTSSSGARLGGGVYLYRLNITSKGGKSATKTKKLIILNNK